MREENIVEEILALQTLKMKNLEEENRLKKRL